MKPDTLTDYESYERGRQNREHAAELIAQRRRIHLVELTGKAPERVRLASGVEMDRKEWEKCILTQKVVDKLPDGHKRTWRNLGLIRTICGYVVKE